MNTPSYIGRGISFFYPGSLWVKRLGHVTMISLIVANLFVSQLQNQLLQQAQDLGQQVTLVTNPAIDQTEFLASVVLPKLKSMESSQLGWALESLGIPRSAELEHSVQELKSWRAELLTFQKMLAIASTVLWWLGILIWTQIVYSTAWIACDLAYGSTRGTTLFLVVTALVVNATSYALITSFLNHLA